MAEITVAATLENLYTVTDFVNEQLELADCSMKLMTQVNLAVEEIYVNIAHYAYHPDVGTTTICCEVGGDPLRITIGFADMGKPYNPLDREDPDITSGAQDRQVGGLGIFMTRKLMDDISYQFVNGKNILTLHKNI